MRKKACVLHTFFKVCCKFPPPPSNTHSRDAKTHFLFFSPPASKSVSAPARQSFFPPRPARERKVRRLGPICKQVERHERVSVGLPRAFAVREMPSTCTTRPHLMKPSPINNSSQLLPDRSPACPYGRLAWGRESKTDRNQMEAERSAGEGRRNSHTNRLYV